MGKPHLDAAGRACCDGLENSTRTGVGVFLTEGVVPAGRAVAADNIQFAMLRIGYRGSPGSIHADELFETFKVHQALVLSRACFFSYLRELVNCFVLQQPREKQEYKLSYFPVV